VTTAKEKNGKGAVLRIEGEMSIYRAAELKQTLLAPLANASRLDIDLSGVTELDTAGVQLLILAKKVAKEKHCELHLAGHSAAVLEVFDLLDLASHFGDQLIIEPHAAGRG